MTAVASDRYAVTWNEFKTEARNLADRWASQADVDLLGVYGIPIGGSIVALEVAHLLDLPLLSSPIHAAGRVLVVDDLVDSGATLRRVLADPSTPHDALFRKSHSPPDLAPGAQSINAWLAFPWERDEGRPTDAVVRLLEFIGEDPTRDGLRDTPRRVTAALAEMTAGYAMDAAAILSVSFDVPCDEMVVIRAVPFTSLCEHHVLPFAGTAALAYIPRAGRVVGLSKLARLVEAYARRLQVQERMTTQIADAMETHLAPQGVGVILRAVHSCMACRGVGKSAEMVTSALRGILLHSPQSRTEFMTLANT